MVQPVARQTLVVLAVVLSVCGFALRFARVRPASVHTRATARTPPPPSVATKHIITTFFRGTYSQARINETLEAAYENLRNRHIKSLHMLWEDADPMHELRSMITARNLDAGVLSKVVSVKAGKQPTYKELFTYANKLPHGTIAVIANADIWFDETLGCVVAERRGAAASKPPPLPPKDHDGQVIPDGRKDFVLALGRLAPKHCWNRHPHFNGMPWFKKMKKELFNRTLALQTLNNHTHMPYDGPDEFYGKVWFINPVGTNRPLEYFYGTCKMHIRGRTADAFVFTVPVPEELIAGEIIPIDHVQSVRSGENRLVRFTRPT